jgi:rhamnosyltransferase
VVNHRDVNICAVIVCYRPDLGHLRHTCDCLVRTVATVILVDNSEQSSLTGTRHFDDCAVIANQENVGIARAQNMGIARALETGAEVVVFFDQDSKIGPGFLPLLLAELRPGIPAVVAPVVRDSIQGFEHPSSRVSKFGVQRRVYAGERVAPYAVDIVLSSGTTATVETFQRAGLMDEELFIDYVDTEWCLRCRRRNIPIHVVPTAVMEHSVGSRSIDLRVVRVLVHSPLRCYYQVRNCFRLFNRESVPLLLAIREAMLLVMHKSLLIIAVPNRGAYVKACAAGVHDGIMGVTGKRPDS